MQMYATSGPLTVRTRIHKLYTRPQMDFIAWVLDHVPWRGDETVLDIGCGAGAYVEPVCRRLRGAGRLLAGDLSPGMLRDLASQPLPGCVALFNANAMCLPLPNLSCDVVLANHVLALVPEIRQALAEIYRVLRPGGVLVAATNSRYSMQTFLTELETACRALGHPKAIPPSPAQTGFALENGLSLVQPVFPNVERHTLQSELVFPDAGPAMAYIHSLRAAYDPLLPNGITWDALMEQVRRQVHSKVAVQGEYRVPKTTGVFIATRE
ncbi:MAG TPA: class I SAM-dependent methyltransferase [Chloroflexi bacterium]|nr:class I SAM-dependent methyltransferase [Chloroflexota bacterium]